MNIDTELLNGSINPFNIAKLIKFRMDFAKERRRKNN